MKKDFVSLAEARPDLAKEWNYEKNGDLKPEDVSCGCNKKVWWKLPYDVPDDYPVEHLRGKHFEFEWEASINNRTRGAGCPYFYGRVWKGFNDLQTVNPELARQWHSTKNGNLTPTQIAAKSNKKVWWLFPYDDPNTGKHFEFEWQAIISSRNAGLGCPFISGKAVWEGFNDLQTVNSELARQWHPTKNGDLKPTQVTANSSKMAWWILSYDVPLDYPVKHLRDKHFDFEWQAKIQSRNNDRGCPYLSRQAVWEGFNDLQTVNPELARQWHPTKNGDLKPTQVTANSNKMAWWILSYDVPLNYPVKHLRDKHFDFEWQANIENRNNDSGCPYLNGRAVWEGFNDLQTVNPELAAQWHPTKNGDLKPTQITANSSKMAWWILSYDVPNDYPIDHLRGGHFDFEWEAGIGDRNNGTNCPYLIGQAVWTGFNDLVTVNPELARQWHPTKNGDLKPTQVTANSNKMAWWTLSYDVPLDYPVKHLRGKHFDFEWQAKVHDRNKGYGCPYLNGRAVWEGFNDLQTVNQELAAQWHPTKNGNLKPTQVPTGSGRKIWWLLPYDDPKIEKCFNLEWLATINHRNNGSGCPYLIIYKGEEYIKQYLQKNNIVFNAQQKFSDLLGTGDGQLSYDFSIPNEKYGYVLIEYNGIQHYEANDYFGGEEKFKIQKEHDKRKRDYAKKHGYKLITVKYTYDTYESVEEYLNNELKKLGVINDTKKEESVNDAA